MKALSDGLKSTRRELVGTRKRFILMLVIQTIGFGLSVRRLGGSVKEICLMGVWGWVFPVLFQVTLKKVVVELQFVSGDDSDAT